MIELDHLHVTLTKTHLIEASAGTGKTYAITGIFLRLLLEEGLAPEQILVVTYTEAATRELRGRIRDRIRAALLVFDGEKTDDPFLSSLAANANGKGPGTADARNRLERALAAFDTASIFTIHAFCLRALQENAFESGSLFDTELIADQNALLQEVVNDFWRISFFSDVSPLLREALRKDISPETWLHFLKDIPSGPKTEVRPSFDAEAIAAVTEKCRSLRENACRMWRAERGEIMALLENARGLKQAAGFYRADLLPALFDKMDAWVDGGDAFSLFTGVDRFTASGIAAGTKPTGKSPSHPFFLLCEELMQSLDTRFLALKWELVAFCRRRLPELKREKNIRFFDDLLNDLYDALNGESKEALAGGLREKYRAALIDEFQDTDPVQYDIFRMIYGATECPLFLIGDPKQAIYSFRGADIFAYREAAGDVTDDHHFTLTGNWRSSPRLLDAFNTVFANAENPFVYEWITYHPVRPGSDDAGKDAPVFVRPAPLELWVLPPGGDGKPLATGAANALIPQAVAGEIVRLLDEGEKNGIMIDGHPLYPGDIAVLVRTKWQAADIRKALNDCRIPSVVRTEMSVFASTEARELLTLLIALGNPSSETKIRAALVTDILGRSGDSIARLLDDGPGWEGCVETFRNWHQTWVDRGFMVMAQTLLAMERIRGRLLGFPDGERRLTNLLHCLELLHHREHEQKPGIEGLIAWFAERIASVGDAAESEEHQIRLETDAKAVGIVTVHVSKGLEYPIVFCPYLWGGIIEKGEVVAFHDGLAAVRDFGSAAYAEGRKTARREALAESLRLLYVALTRAKYRCCLVAGKVAGRKGFGRPETSALAYLLHASDAARAADDAPDRLIDEMERLSQDKIMEQLEAVQKKGNGTIAVFPLPESDFVRYVPSGDGEAPPAVRKFSGFIRSDWRVASFTSFSAHGVQAAELPDRDGIATGEKTMAAPAGERTIFTFPRGAQAGIFFHEIFEELNFADISKGAVDNLVLEKLNKYRYEEEWRSVVRDAVTNVVTVPLALSDGVFTLSDLRPGRWVSEMEFYFPLNLITSDLLGDCLKTSRHDAADLAKIAASLGFRPVRGMVRGFIDMVFEHGGKYYLVDWKSNYLGGRSEDYGPYAVKAAMEKSLYPLQYLLYTVALNRYLSQRVRGYDYETSFGGVIYIFLRGISAEQGEKYGIFRDIPSPGLIAGLTGALIENEERMYRKEV